YKPHVPVVSFYSKEKQYLTLLERKQLNESLSLGERNRVETLPASSRTEKMSRNMSSKPTKHTTSSRHGKTIPRTLKKVKGEVPVGKPSVEKENVSCLIKKKMDSPFRVLSMTVKPALKLQSGAAFFSARKKSHSKKPLVDAKSLQDPPRSLQEKDQPGPPTPPKPNSADGNKTLEASRVLRSISVPQKEENETQEDSTNQERGSGGEGKPSPWGSGTNPAPCCPSADSDTENVVSRGVTRGVWVALTEPAEHAGDELAAPFGSNPPPKPSHTAQKKKARELCRRSGDQMIIDAGQKHFGAVVCKSCGMIYTAASPEDEAQHIQHHERFLEVLRYVGWKKERVVAEFWDGKIVLILPDDPKYAIKKADDVREIVDNELGFKQVALSCPAKTKIYLFVSNEKMIVGCLVAESIKQ
ncbi:ESCO2 acetyltransferase, partial [Aegotheles bennettii]|nr:ESCO2 acetyltransferase [Aegotheles bennettii]